MHTHTQQQLRHTHAHTHTHSNMTRPEGWVAGSLYMELKDDRERAIEYIEKALQLQPRHTQVRKGRKNSTT
jgi:hypothetical protein